LKSNSHDDEDDDQVVEGGAKLPEYMKQILRDFDDDFLDDEEIPVPAAKLPLIAIIGRPNTGKSTIVNKLTDSYKVGSYLPNIIIRNYICN
jgi:ribosome biogenesis GTPase A